jgi:hypothetical protein
MSEVPEVNVEIFIDGQSYNDYVVFSQTSFECVAFAQAGRATITLRDPEKSLDPPISKEVWLYIEGKRVYGGYIMSRRCENFFPAGDGLDSTVSRKWVLEAVDYNVLLDKFVVWNKEFPKKPCKTFKPLTTDKQIIDYYTEKYSNISDSGFDHHSMVQVVGTPIPAGKATDYALSKGYTGAGYIVGPGATYRAMLEEVSKNLVALSDTGDDAMAIGWDDAVVYYVDAFKRLVWRTPESNGAPFAITDGGGGVGAREVSITHDISQLKNDVFVWGLERAPLKFKRTFSPGSVGKYGRWQYAEHLTNSFEQKVVNAHARALANMYLNPTRTAKFTIFTPGLEPGMLVQIEMSAMGVSELMPLRSMSISFVTPTTVRFDCECLIETNTPWRYWMSLKRAERKGMEQPTFRSAALPSDDDERVRVMAIPGQYFNEVAPLRITDNRYRTAHPFIKGSARVFVDGLALQYGVEYWDHHFDDGFIDLLDSVDDRNRVQVTYHSTGPRKESLSDDV